MQKRNRSRGPGIFMTTAGLVWGIALMVVLILACLIIPGQTRAFKESLRSKSQAISASLNEVTSSSVVSEDYSSVVDHCMKTLDGDDSILYLVITRNDGFSLIHRRGSWEMQDLGRQWRPLERVESDMFVESPKFADASVYAHSVPFDYSGIEWGWLHVGLSLDSYHANLENLYRQVAYSAAIALIVALIASVLYSRYLAAPIIKLRDAVWCIAQGELSVKADLAGVSEIAELADSVNRMTESLNKRTQVLEVLRSIGQELLAAEGWEKKLPRLMADLGRAVQACGICVYERIADESDGMGFGRRVYWQDSGEADIHGWDFPEILELKEWGLLDYESDLKRKKRASFVSSEIQSLKEGGLLHASGVKHLIVNPVMLRQQVWGLQVCVSRDSSQTWSQAEFDAFSAVADMLSTVIERDAASAELIAEKENAEAASHAKTRFLANMSHEIRTPINGIMGMLQLLKRTSADKRSMGYVETALRSSEGLLSVIGNILDLSKIEAGKLDVEERVFDLSEFCPNLLGPFAGQSKDRGIELICYLDENAAGSWKGAEGRIQQILVNLLGNAFKFTTHGEIVLHVTANLPDKNKSELIFEVRDTGSGISIANQKKVFDSFVQVDDSLTRQQAGTGLGLTICRDICRMLNGRISLQSAVGVGSVFTVRIPADRIASDKDRINVERAKNGKKARVLIVDDSPTVQGVLSSYVKSWGFTCEAVGGEAECLNQLRRAAVEGVGYDLVLIDRGIPSVDVYGLVKQVRDLTFTANTNFILMDNYADPLSAEELVKFGFYGSISKPIGRSQLYNIIVNSLEMPHSSELMMQLTPAPFSKHLQSKLCGRILVAEDNEVNQEVATELLVTLGFEVECVTNGLAAVNRINEGGIDCLLLDCQMPVMDGYSAAREIRAIEEKTGRAHLPIVALTAHALDGDRTHCLEAGMDDYLSKPLNFDDLEQVLRKRLAHLEITGEGDADGNETKLPDALPETISKPAINYTELLARVRGNEDLATRLVTKFEVQAAADLAEIEDALVREDEEALRMTSHRLKGSALTVSANHIAAASKAIEKSPDATWAERGDLVECLKQALSELKEST